MQSKHMDEKALQTIQGRQQKEKQLLVEQLKKTPIVQLACEKTGVGRSTYYRWRKEDEDFTKQTEEALAEGASLVNDMAESQLMAAIRDQNMTAVIFWLKHHHPAYGTKVEVTGTLKTIQESLTPEQEALITKALQLVTAGTEVSSGEEEKETE